MGVALGQSVPLKQVSRPNRNNLAGIGGHRHRAQISSAWLAALPPRLPGVRASLR